MLIEFTKPEVILLIPFFVALAFMSHYFAQKIKRSLEVFHYPPVQRLVKIAAKKNVQRQSWRGISLALKITVVLLLTFGLAGPTFVTVGEVSRKVEIPMVEEKDVVGGIILAVDVSASMSFTDVTPSRLEVAKSMLIEFVENASESVRFGVVAFSSEIVTSIPLTENRESVVAVLEGLQPSEGLPCLEEITDIGFGAQIAVQLLTPYTAFNRTYVIVMVSDGFANYGYPDPFTSVSLAIDDAVNENIPIYTVHVAKLEQDSNKELLEWVAEETEGKSMESTDTEELRDVLSILAKYHTPTNAWNAIIEIKTTIPQRTEIGHILMYGVALVMIVLWTGNYKHFKTAF